MVGLELVVALGVAVLVGNLVARRFGVAVPVVLGAGGSLTGYNLRRPNAGLLNVQREWLR